MIISSWNVNSVRARIENIKEYLNNFMKHKMTENRLQHITDDTYYLLEILIPDNTIRIKFEQLCKTRR